MARKHVNYTTTDTFAKALTVAEEQVNLMIVNLTGSQVDIGIDHAGIDHIVENGAALTITTNLKLKNAVWARFTSGGSGAAGLEITAWS